MLALSILFYFKDSICLRERERGRESAQVGEGPEGGEADSPLSREPDPEIMTWAQGRRLLD